MKYLKTAQVLLMQACGRYVITDVTEVGMRVKRTRGGLPTVIPAVQRDLIRSGDIQVIKF